MISKEITIPSKTFLLGEYVALENGPSLLVNSAPFFTLQITSHPHTELFGVEPNSPAGRFFQDHRNEFQPGHYRFTDHHQGLGGFGASTAQFAALYQQIQPLKQPLSAETLETLLNIYRHYAHRGVGPLPSGADLISQLYPAGLCAWHPQRYQLQHSAWPFPRLALLLLRTGTKVATHEHLQQLTMPNLTDLVTWVAQAIDSLDSGDELQFIDAINQARETLATLGLTAPETLALYPHLATIPGILAYKGCGALGADVLAILSPSDQLPQLTQELQQLGLAIVTCITDE